MFGYVEFVMFGFGRSKLEKLQEKYNRLLKEAYELSHEDRSKSDAKNAEADKVLKEIESLEQG